jgi:dihydrofolate reductase
MSLDGFIAGPGHAMDWGNGRALADFVAPEDVAEIAAATGAMLVGRRTWEVGDRMEAEEPGSVDYPFSGPMFLLSHRPLDPPDPDVTILSGDIGDAVATALDAAGEKNLEILGADVAGQCLQRGLVDEILVYVLPVLLGDGIPFSSRASPGRTWNRSAARGPATPPSSASGSASSRSDGRPEPPPRHTGGCGQLGGGWRGLS